MRTLTALVVCAASSVPAGVPSMQLHGRCGRARRQLSVANAPACRSRFVVGFTAGHFANTDFPKDGWGGSQNPWDAAEYVRTLINQLSSMPTAQATEALAALQKLTALSSFADHLKHAISNQRSRRRDTEYRQPDWKQTIQALKNGAPAGVSDLHALLVAHLEDIRAHIAGSNTDIFKRFWNEDSHGRPIDPKVEESCRDALTGIAAS